MNLFQNSGKSVKIRTMNAYPKKFREKVLEAIEKGHSKKEVAEMFGINPKTIRKWEHLKEETGGLNDKVAERSSYKINRDRLLEYYKNNEEKRQEFIKEIESLSGNEEIFYIDESGFNKFYTREYGYSLRGEKVLTQVKGEKYTKTSIVAAKHNDKIVAAFAFEGCMNSSLFEGWFEEIFIKALTNPKKSVVILDNAAFHRKQALFDIAKEHGFKIIFLPTYCQT